MGYKSVESKAKRLERYHRIMEQVRFVLGGECIACGSTEDLEADHIDRNTKSFVVSQGWERPAEIFWLEVAKCQLLCEPHHKEKSIAEGDTSKKGSSNGLSKLTEFDIQVVRALFRLGHSQRKVAKLFGVSHTVIGDIHRGKTWTHV